MCIVDLVTAEDPQTTTQDFEPWPRPFLRSFREGETKVLSAVYREYAPRIAGLLRHGFSFRSGGQPRRFVGYASAFDFQDALHDTFRRAFEPKARISYDGLRPYGPYIATIARNVVIAGFRAKERLFPAVGAGPESVSETAETPAHLATHTAAAPPQNPEAAAHDASVRRLVTEFLAQLSPEDQALVRLRYSEGAGQQDVAAALGVGRQVIRTREKKIRRALIRYLQARGETQWLPQDATLLLAAAATAQLIKGVA